jgi:hypothetical protein
MMRTKHQFFTSGAAVLALAGAAAGLSGSAFQVPVAAVAQPSPPVLAVIVPLAPAEVVEAVAPPPQATAAVAEPASVVAQASVPTAAVMAAVPVSVTAAPETAATRRPAISLADLRARVRWMRVQVNGRAVLTPDPDSRLLLARSAAERAGLAEVGLDFRDVYGVITAETSWVPRTGMGRNGVASQGLAQFEPATARALGVRDANDPVEAVHGAALLLREAGAWSARRIAGLRLTGADYAARLREGISVYYNLSSRARQRWDGATHTLPLETRRHIVNVRAGIQQAEQLQTGSGPSVQALLADAAVTARVAAPATSTPPARPRGSGKPHAATAPLPVGTISWSGHGGDANARRAGTHVVWSNGSVTHDGSGRVHWSSRSRG